MRLATVLCLVLLFGCTVQPEQEPVMPLLRNDALKKNPILRRMPQTESEWTRWIQTLDAQKVVEIGAIVLSEHIRLGQTAYDTGTGFWLGDDGGTPKVSIGNSSGNKVTWDGSTLSITGTVTATSGTIGGWTLGSTSLTSGSGANTVGLDSGGTNPAFYAGSATPASAPFRVTQAGALTATSATITGDLTGGKVAYKTAATTRDNTTTLTADPDLQLALNASAVYKIELQLLFRGETSTSGNQGFNFAMGYSGSLAIEGSALGYKIVDGVPAVHNGSTGAFVMSSGPIPGGVAPIATGALDGDGFHVTWIVETSTAGTLSVNWAQAVSSGDDTSVLQGSYLIATRLSQ